MSITSRDAEKLLFGPSIGANSDPPGMWRDYLSGKISSAPVSETKALNLSAVWCAVTIISNAMKCLPLFVYERQEGHGKRAATEHDVYDLVHDNPSPHFSPSRFQRLLVFWAVLWGNGRAWIERNRLGKIIDLHPIHPSRSKTEVRADGSRWHLIRNDDGTWTELPDRDVFHIQGLSEDGVSGLSVLGYARRSLGLAVSAEEYGLRFFDNNARPSVVLSHPQRLNDEARIQLKKSWASAFGTTGQHGTAVLEEGMVVHTLGMPNEDAQFLETRQFQTIEIARWFNIPPHKLKDLERATFSNIVEQSLEFVGETILPWAKDWEQEAQRKLLIEDDRKTFFLEFLLDALLRADPKSRNEAYEIQRRNGVINANTWAARENMNRIPGSQGEMYIVMGNMVNAKVMAEAVAGEQVTVTDDPDTGAHVETVSPEPVAGTDDDAVAVAMVQAEEVARGLVPLFADVFCRMAHVELNAARRAAKKECDLDAWSVEYFEKHAATLRSSLIPCVESLGAAVRVVISGDPTDDQWDTFVGEFTKTATVDHCTWARNLIRSQDIEDSAIRMQCSARAFELVNSFAEQATGELV